MEWTDTEACTVYLARKGFHYSPITIHKYMNKEMGLYAIVRPKKPEYIHGKPHKVFENKLAQNFTAERANQKWCTDFTYLFLKNGEVRYNCSILDLYDRSIIASITDRHITSELAIRTFYRRPWIRSRCGKGNYSFIAIKGHSIHRKHSLSIVNPFM